MHVKPRIIQGAVMAGLVTLASLSTLISFAPRASAYTPHAPIHIESDTDFTHANGVDRGNGTPSDPFIIEGWEIDASLDDGIGIWNTDKAFIVQHVYIHSTSSKYRGVNLESSHGGLIMESVISGNRYGINTEFATLKVMANTISDNRYGVYSQYSANIAIINNSISGGTVGVVLEHCESAVVSDNAMANGASGIELFDDDNATIATNTIAGFTYGIRIDSSDDASIVGNSLRLEVQYGIYVESAEGSIVSGNDVSNGEYGISFSYSNNSLIANNSVRSNIQAGVYIFTSANIAITNNTVMDNLWGTVLNGSAPVSAYHNDFLSNSWQSFDNRIALNRWDNGYPSGGNFWSDYGGPDQSSGPGQDQPGPDSIGDWGYFVSEGASDRYPFMIRHALADPPDAFFNVSPTDGQNSTVFTVDASSSSDLKTRSEDLEVRWDWEEDGIWDTAWSTDKIAQHQYSTPGYHQIRLQVRDEDDSASVTTRRVFISGDSSSGLDALWWLASIIFVAAAIIVILIFLYLRRMRRTVMSVPQTVRRDI